MPGRKTFSAILATMFMEKSRNELLSSKGNEKNYRYEKN